MSTLCYPNKMIYWVKKASLGLNLSPMQLRIAMGEGQGAGGVDRSLGITS